MYAPMGIDLQSKWRIAGNQPDEPPDLEGREPRSAGAPANGLYLREDVEIQCNLTLISFVKNQLKAASKVLVDRLIKKAELLDAGVLQAMMEDGKLRTYNPADRSNLVMSPSVRHSGLDRRASRWSSQTPTSPVEYENEREQGGSGSVSGSTKYSLPPRYSQKSFVAELPADSHHPQSGPKLEKYTELPSRDKRFSSSRHDKEYPAELPQ
jgi:hypothetical protein